VLVAVACLGLLAGAVRVLDLIAMASLLRYVFESIILLVIVVFQQELRRALLYLGQRLMPAGRREAAQSAVEELIAGLERLKRARVGALVILQGEIDVLAVVTGRGIPIDAPLRAETLVALQVPHAVNTAHDGAVIIQDFRIARAGVICPLTEQQVDPRFGTRHRAAIGATEETDALVIVVSEERGEVRIVQRGTISEPLRISELEGRIAQWLAEPRAEATRAPGDAEASRADLSAVDLDRSAIKRLVDDEKGSSSTRPAPRSVATVAKREQKEASGSA
jgi:DNA integrity scanning protein DisA with diadenylate cyclase activity